MTDHIELVPDPFRRSLDELAQQVKDIVNVDIVQSFAGGFSESAPLLAYANYQHTGAYQVFKVGDRDIINQEAQNWRAFIKNGPYNDLNVVHKKEHIQAGPHSLIVYNFAGRISDRPRTFEEFYAQTANPEGCLQNLFQKLLTPLATNVQKDTTRHNLQ